MIRLRRGKSCARGVQPSGISEIAAPSASDRFEQRAVLRRIDAVLSAGQHRDGAGGELARCAAASTPRASPEAITKPASPSSRARRSANFRPAAEALREPTIATIGRDSAASCRARRSAAAHRRFRRGAADRRPRNGRQRPTPNVRGRLDFALGVGARADADRACRAATLRQRGQSVERRARRCRNGATASGR